MKNTIATFTLAIVLTFGATFANAGIMVSDAKVNPCATETKGGIIVTNSPGIIVTNAPGGIIVTNIVNAILGIIVTNKPAPCKSVDRNGIMVSD
jgi:hypothetical protein